MTTIQSLRLDGLLSFASGSQAFVLKPLNVLIGLNGSGMSNVMTGKAAVSSAGLTDRHDGD